MMTIGIKRRLATSASQTETPTQNAKFARPARRRRAGPVAMLLSAALICSSLAITGACTTAGAQGRAGSAVQKARKNAERRREITRSAEREL